MRTGFWHAGALLLGTLALSACGEGQEAAESSAPEAPEGIAASNGRLMLPAVSGNPAAVYFDLTNSGERDMMIRTVAVQGAGSAVMHQMGTWNLQPSMDELMQLAVKAGETVKFEPGGLHVMVGDLAETVTPGSQTEVTLTFVGGDKVSFPAEVRAAGDER